ncbi:MAG: hypothetical protein E7451_01600 [Ruminococcaceae bacterium]|nr:hypothetical protein [Oscillospiraceae bacterium]
MHRDLNETEMILVNAKEILHNRPELASLTITDVINELDTTEDMVRDRWGVAAWLVINSIEHWNLDALVDCLSLVADETLTFEYVGYILQAKYGIDLIELLLAAEEKEKFDKIVPIVVRSIESAPYVDIKRATDVISMLHKHISHHEYGALLTNYACLCTAQNCLSDIAALFRDLQNSTEYEFMRRLRWKWYEHNPTEANDYLDIMLSNNTIWNHKAGIDFWECCFSFDLTKFHSLFPIIDNLCSEDSSLWLHAIPIYVSYVDHSSVEETETQTYSRVVNRLKGIGTGSSDAKRCFLSAVEYGIKNRERLNVIIDVVISFPLGKDAGILKKLDYPFSKEVLSGKWEAILEQMQYIFRTSQFESDYPNFFNVFPNTLSALSVFSAETTMHAIKCMLASDICRVFFGLGLLHKAGKITKIQIGKTQDGHNVFSITETQIIRLMKIILYFGVDSKEICHTAYQLLGLCNGKSDQYLHFCMNEVYYNYPSTMHSLSEQYLNSTLPTQIKLAELVSSAHQQMIDDFNDSYAIKDLLPSREHQRIFQKARYLQSKQMNHKSRKNSFAARYFPSRTLKYGIRTAFIQYGRKNEMFYRIAPHQTISVSMELPTVYVNDPLEYNRKQMNTLNEVANNAIDN